MKTETLIDKFLEDFPSMANPVDVDMWVRKAITSYRRGSRKIHVEPDIVVAALIELAKLRKVCGIEVVQTDNAPLAQW